MRDDRERPVLSQAATSDRLSRRTVLKRAAAFGIVTPALVGLLAACGGDDDASETPEGSGGAGAGGETPTTTAVASGGAPTTAATTSAGTAEAGTATSQGQGTPGGTLRVAQFEEAITLDLQTTTQRETSLPGWLMYEPLFAWSDSFEVIPMLAESHEVSEDGLLQTLTIRQGVPFHNGQEMTATDVVASIQRWATRNSIGKAMLELVEEITQVDDYTIEFSFTEPYSIFAGALGLLYGGCAIHPESVITAAGEGEITEFIGTGPYQFVKWDRGQAIRLERFEDYAALPGEPNGYGGHKYAYVDAIEITGVSDEAARVASLRAGDYDYVERISGDQVPTLEGDDSVVVSIMPANGWDTMVINSRSPLTGDLKIRQAIQVALDHGPILEAGRGAGFYELYPSLMPEGTIWYTEAGGELYNQADPEKAKQLIEEAGYDGTPLRMMTTQSDLTKYNASVVIKQQLEEVGFTVDLQLYDWATIGERRVKEDLWDAFVVNFGFRPEPIMSSPLDCNYPGWWCSVDSEAARDGLLTEMDFDARFPYWEQLQTLLFQEVPNTYLGQTSDVFAQSAKLQGVPEQGQMGMMLWNAWFEE